MSQDNETLPVQDELAALKQRADQIGLKYHPSIGVEALREKVNKAMASEGPVNNDGDDDQGGDQNPPAPPPAAVAEAPVRAETAAEKRTRKRKEAAALVRVRVTCMNPAKKDWEGEIITAGNAVAGSFKKYVPFNNDEGWHVPRIIFNVLKRRECPIYVTKVVDGRKTRVGKLIKEFAVEELPQLTEKELKELAQRQAMARGTQAD